jgi:hypothetical protein
MRRLKLHGQERRVKDAAVAAEVKNLANQTSKATDDIARKIAEMQNVSLNVSNGCCGYKKHHAFCKRVCQ